MDLLRSHHHLVFRYARASIAPGAEFVSKTAADTRALTLAGLAVLVRANYTPPAAEAATEIDSAVEQVTEPVPKRRGRPPKKKDQTAGEGGTYRTKDLQPGDE